MGSEELLYMLNAQCTNHLWQPPGCGMHSLTGESVEENFDKYTAPVQRGSAAQQQVQECAILLLSHRAVSSRGASEKEKVQDLHLG